MLIVSATTMSTTGHSAGAVARVNNSINNTVHMNHVHVSEHMNNMWRESFGESFFSGEFFENSENNEFHSNRSKALLMS